MFRRPVTFALALEITNMETSIFQKVNVCLHSASGYMCEVYGPPVFQTIVKNGTAGALRPQTRFFRAFSIGSQKKHGYNSDGKPTDGRPRDTDTKAYVAAAAAASAAAASDCSFIGAIATSEVEALSGSTCTDKWPVTSPSSPTRGRIP